MQTMPPVTRRILDVAEVCLEPSPERADTGSPERAVWAQKGQVVEPKGISFEHFGQSTLGSPSDKMLAGRSSAGQAGAVEGEPVEGAEDGRGNLFGTEKIASEILDVFASDGINGSKNFVERKEALEIEFLAREIGHSRICGLERKHERAFEVILGAEKFFLGDGRFLEGAKFGDGEVHDLANSFFCGAGVDGEHAGVGVRRDFAENGVGEAALFSNVLEKTRGHAAAEKIVENSDDEAAVVRDGQRRNAQAEMNLFEIGLAVELNRRAGMRRNVAVETAARFEMAELLFDEFGDLIVRDVARGGDEKVIGCEPLTEAAAQHLW